MNIILVSGKLARARTITLSMSDLVCGAAASLVGLLILSFALQYLVLRFAPSLHGPLLNTLILSAQHERYENSDSYLRENLNALAAKLGQMQAQLLRLDTLGERLAKTAGFKPQDFMFDQPPGRGGADRKSVV